jgi:hypothetical protein
MKNPLANWTLALPTALTIGLAVAALAWMPGAKQPKYRTDLDPAPETVPALCSPKRPAANCRMTSSDLNPQINYFRVTNPNTMAPQYAPRQFGTSNSIDNDWSIDDSTFVVSNLNGSVVPIELSSSHSRLTTTPVLCNSGDPNCTCNQAGPACSAAISGILNINGTAVFSKLTPNQLVTAVSSRGGWAFSYVDLRPVIASAESATISIPITPSIHSCSGIQLPSRNTVGLIGVSQNDGRITTSTGGPRQDNWSVVYVWDTAKRACRYLDLTRMAIGGDTPWGSPTGSAELVDENGRLLDASDPRYKLCSTDGTAAPACMHGAQITPDGKLAVFSTTVDNYEYFWDIDSLKIYLCGVNKDSGTCSGHGVMGSGLQLFLLNSSKSLIQTHSMPASPALPTNQLYPVANEPKGFGNYEWDTHANWNSNTGSNLQPFLFLPWSPHNGAYPPTVGWGDELVLGFATGSTAAYRIAHTYNRAVSFYDQGLPQISHNGTFAIFGSSWGGTDIDAGDSSCKRKPCYRTDVFLVPIPDTRAEAQRRGEEKP